MLVMNDCMPLLDSAISQNPRENIVSFSCFFAHVIDTGWRTQQGEGFKKVQAERLPHLNGFKKAHIYEAERNVVIVEKKAIVGHVRQYFVH